MKRLLTLAVLLVALTIGAEAQGNVKFGFKGGLDIQKLAFNESVFAAENKLGWFIGPTIQVSLPAGIGLDISGFYDQKRSEINGETIKQKYILVPINARLKAGLGEMAGVYLAAGPQFAFNIGDDEFSWSLNGIHNTFQLKKANLSLNIGAGVYLSKLEFGFAFNLGVSKAGNATFDDGVSAVKEGTTPKSWQISVAYLF